MNMRSRLKFKSTRCFAILVVSLVVFSTSAAGRSISEEPNAPAVLLQLTLKGSASTCKQDTEIPGNQLSAINDAALAFVRAALGSNPDKVYSKLSVEAQRTTSKKQFENYMRMGIDPFAPFADLRVTHTYLANVLGQPQDNRMVCGVLSQPEGWVSFRVSPSSKQAWVLINGKARNNAWTFAIWLVPVNGGWKVNSINAGASTLADQSAEQIWKVAQSEEQHHHLFNAFVLSNTALQLAQRGTLFEFGIASVIRKYLSSTPVPTFFQGKPPYEWQLGPDRYKVAHVSPLSIAGKIYLIIAYQARPWKNYGEVQQHDSKLIQDFASTLPEYSSVFAGIIAEAHEIGHNGGYRTVAVIHNGKLEILPPPGHKH